tara:strand:- start:438 stop:965 length:528 start_codon:yes stop_codon:yes gene_type:complete
MLKKKYFITFFFIFLFFYQNTYAQEKIVFVDINYVFNNSTVGKNINKEIKEKSKVINSQFENSKKKFEKEKQNLLTQQNVLSKEEFEKKYVKLESDIKSYNQEITKKNNDLINYKNKARIEFNKKLQKILEEFSTSEGIDLIISRDNLLIGKRNLDVTKNILDLLNKNIKKLKIE